MATTLRSTQQTAFPAVNSVSSQLEPAWNVVERVLGNVSRHPGRAALVVARSRGQGVVDYQELGGLITEVGAGLDRSEIPQEARVLIMAPPSIEFYVLALGMLATGRTLVVVDGRMRRSRILHALREAAPDVVIAAPNVMRWWPLLSPLRAARRYTIGGRVAGSKPVSVLHAQDAAFCVRRVGADAPAIISFSSGTTGAAKQIVRSHGVLVAQHLALASAFPAPDHDVNLAGFPMAVLHNLCCGTTTVLPDAELRAVMTDDPQAVIDLIERCGVTSISAAPALAKRIARQAIGSRPIARIEHVVIGGGPVSRALCADVMAAFPNAQASVIYGATEAEPIATVPMREVLTSNGEGFLVGRPVADVDVVIEGEHGIGEVLVRGAHVALPPHNDTWHRTTDVARLDAHGRLWLLGRVGDAVRHNGRVVYAGTVEAIALGELGVSAAGFVAHRAAPEGELALEVESNSRNVLDRVRARLARAGLGTVSVRVVARIPMDARHDSKVERASLARLLERASR
jgi:acyl-CoA synthetase (AMP-forming)/AMP-acid ligase II